LSFRDEVEEGQLTGYSNPDHALNGEMNPNMSKPLRIVLTNIGTMGDINPLIALAIELKRRGHTPIMAVQSLYAPYLEPLGLPLHPIRPFMTATDSRLAEMIYDIRKGTERGLRNFLFPEIRETYEDLLAAVTAEGGADLMLSGELVYAAPLVAEVTGVPWASYLLAPISFFSAYDPPALPMYPLLAKAEAALPAMGHLIAGVARFISRKWPEPIYQLRAELGLPRGTNPLFVAKHSPHLVLALFSHILGRPQPDWPPNVLQPGFVYFDGQIGDLSLSPEMERFLAAGEPPVVFTLGSAASLTAGTFYEYSARAAEELGIRAILLVGKDPRNVPSFKLSPNIFVAEFAPFTTLFPRTKIVVHQGGVGTTAQALRAGIPSLVMPYSHDQPDNARRILRLGTGRVLRRQQYTPKRVVCQLRELLTNPCYEIKAKEAAAILAKEDGLKTACDALENLQHRS
jgi:UDP:flavonoid glycosyltransferase YjiC (YdhE family)